MFNKFFFEKCSIFEVTSKNMVEPWRPYMTKRHMLLHAGWVRLHASKNTLTTSPTNSPTQTRTHTHARAHTQKRAIVIYFVRQMWFRERVSILRYTYVACLVAVYILIMARIQKRKQSLLNVTLTFAVSDQLWINLTLKFKKKKIKKMPDS